MMNNFSCDQLHQDILTSSTQSSLNKHISDGVVHVTKEDHNKINNIPEIQNTVSELSTKVSDIQSTIDDSGYVSKEELIGYDYITKRSVKDLYVHKSQLDDYYTKEDVDDKVKGVQTTTQPTNIQISASTDSSVVSVGVVKQSTGSDIKQDFKFKFSGFDNLGGSTIAESYTIVNVYRTSDSNTTAPQIDRTVPSVPTFWSTNVPSTGKYLWRSQGRLDTNKKYLKYADLTYWSTPDCCGIINGETSEVGTDTESINYVYWSTNDNIRIVAPTFTVEQAKESFENKDYITDEGGGRTRIWYNHPQGVTWDRVYEYCSYATYNKENKEWSPYSMPFIFSHYGTDGKDGDGLEYIYTLSEVKETPTISYSGFTDEEVQKDDFIPSGANWADNPQDVTEQYPYQYVSMRKKNGSTDIWGTFETPSIWSVYIKPRDPEKPADVISQVWYYKYGDENLTVDSTERIKKSAPKGWSRIPPQDAPTDRYLYMTIANTVNGNTVADKNGFYWSEAIRITGERGPAGTSITGKDGTDINYIYARTKDKTPAPAKPTFTVDDLNNYPGQYDQDDPNYETITWYDHPSGVDTNYTCEWVSIATKKVGETSFGPYSNPVRWSVYGDRGTDGDSVEYIYKRAAEEAVPEKPVAKYGDNRDDDIPDGWTDDPQGVTEDYPYEYVSTRTKHEGTWELYTTPALWAKYGKDGQQGPQGEPGINGKDGVSVMINTRRWEICKVGDVFQQGQTGEIQVDVVLYNGKYYRCIKSYTLEDKAVQSPTNTEYWSEFESFTNIATELVLADEASIENLLLNKAKAKNSSTGEVTVEIDGNTGNFKANNATLTNAYVEGSVQASTIGYDLSIPRTIQSEMGADGSLANGSNSTWKYSSVGNAIVPTAIQLLDCKQSVYMFNQTYNLPNQKSFIEKCGGYITYALPSPRIAGKVVIDLYFRYDREYITKDGNQLTTVRLATVEPELGLSIDNEKVTPESEYGCYTANSYHSTNASNTLMNLSTLKINGSRRPITPCYITLNKEFTSDQQDLETDAVDANLPSHIKLLSDGESYWYILEIDELF